MTQRRTEGQRRALWELSALARTGIDVCDLLASRAEENSDAPRHYLTTLDRWTRGEESGATLAARTRALNAWCGGAPSLTEQGSGVDMALLSACQWLVDARADLMANPGHKHHTHRVVAEFARVTRWVQPDDQPAAETMVRRWLDAHRAEVASEAADARRTVALAQAKIDKVAAEHALALPGVE